MIIARCSNKTRQKSNLTLGLHKNIQKKILEKRLQERKDGLKQHLNERNKFDQDSKIIIFISDIKVGITLSKKFRRDFIKMSATPKIC